MRSSTSWLLLSGVALALSCDDGKKPRAFLAECTFNDECASGLICAARRCRVECRGDRDCTNDWRCLSAGQAARYACYAPDDFGSACEHSADCRASWVCADRECRPQCRHDYDCAVLQRGLTCIRALGVCSAHPNLTDAGTLPDVDINDPDGAFTLPPADAGAVDGGAVDAGSPADAGAVDGGAVDAGPSVDAGDPFACAARGDGGTACRPGPGCGVVGVGIGRGTRCAVFADGSVRCWGGGMDGSLGAGVRTGCAVPGLVTGLVDAVAVGVGGTFACARRRAGAGVVCWGTSNVGELGNGTAQGAVTPTPTPNSAPDGELFVGNSHACTLRAGGAASCWGDNGSGQFGNGTLGGMTIYQYWSTPRPVSLPVRALSLGVAHACGVALDGSALCWGSNMYGALGDGTTTGQPSPTPVPGLAAVEEVLAGQTHSCARLADGTARCWGGNTAGQIGDGTRTDRPTPFAPPLAGVAELAIGHFATCARTSDGRVWCWGDRVFTGLGGMATAAPTVVPGLSGVTRIYGGGAGFCALRGADAELWCWGRASGNVATETAMSPVEVSW